MLEHYLFSSRGEYFLALGVGSLFNHSCRPCLDYRVLRDQLVITYTAARDIQVGDPRCLISRLLLHMRWSAHAYASHACFEIRGVAI